MAGALGIGASFWAWPQSPCSSVSSSFRVCPATCSRNSPRPTSRSRRRPSGLSADEVEQLITVPLEADLLHGVAFLDEIQSESVAGLSSIVMIFEPGTDIFRARQVVAERLTQAHALPNVSKPPAMLQPLSSASRVLMVVDVLSGHVTRSTCRSWPMDHPAAPDGRARRRQRRGLGQARAPAPGPGRPGTPAGRRASQLQQVIETTGNALWVSPLTFLDASTPGTGGFIDTPNQRLGIQHVLPIRTPQDLAQVRIAPEVTNGTDRPPGRRRRGRRGSPAADRRRRRRRRRRA